MQTIYPTDLEEDPPPPRQETSKPPVDLHRTLPAPPPKEDPVPVVALRHLLDKRPDEAMALLQRYGHSNQEMLLCLLPMVARLSEKSIDQFGPAEIAALQDQLQSLQVALRPRAEFVIARMCLCETVKQFGVYKPWPEGHVFRAKSDRSSGDLVQLYVELRNFASVRHEQFYETRLASSIQLVDARGKEMYFCAFRDEKEPICSRTLLQDYSNNYSFYVPHIPAGCYKLVLTVEDRTRPQPRVARQSVDFQVTNLPLDNH
jgi:hypothetical protein